MDEETYEDAVEEQEEAVEDQQDIQEGQVEQYDAYSPQAKEKADIFAWFSKVVSLMEPYRLIRIGNLKKDEIGEHIISIRDSMNLAMLGEIFHHNTFGVYWQNRARITAASSMSKDGWLIESSISQRKIREKSKKSSGLTPAKWRLFSNRKNQPVPQ